MRSRRKRLILPVAGALVGTLVGLVGNLAASQEHWPGPLQFLHAFPWQSLLVLAIIGAGLAMLPHDEGTEQDLAGIADLLAIAVRRQWEKEAIAQRLHDPWALKVRWRPASANLFAEWSALIRLANAGPGKPPSPAETWAASPAELAGTGKDLVDVLARVPTGRLVVLGEPGAGKTILLIRLVLDRLSLRNPGDPVPVLLSMASWNPTKQDLFTWMEQRLTTESDALAARAQDKTGRTLARALLDANLILPVLDGLDEILATAVSSSISGLNAAMRTGQQLVVAARTEDYKAAVRPPSGIEMRLIGAAGVELCPLETENLVDYLRDSAGGPEAASRWDWLASADGSSAVMQALRTPLMASLAREAYDLSPGDNADDTARLPSELLDFPTRQKVIQHLFDQFVPAAYRGCQDPSSRCKWTVRQAQSWLEYLASYLEVRRGGTTDFAWWQLTSAAPRWLDPAVVGLIGGVAAAVGFPFPSNFGIGLVTALVVAFGIGRWVRLGPTGLTWGFAGGILGGLIGALATAVVFGITSGFDSLGARLGGGLAFGVAIAAIRRFTACLIGAIVGCFAAAVADRPAVHEIGLTLGPPARLINGIGVGLVVGLSVALTKRNKPSRGWRWSPLGLVCGLVCAVVMGFIAWIEQGLIAGVAVGLMITAVGGLVGGFFSEAGEADVRKATSPSVIAARDRATFRSSVLGLGLGTGLVTGVAIGISPAFPHGFPTGIQVAVGVGLANLIAVGLTFGFVQAVWGSFTLARYWLAVAGHLPWRLMPFLADAQNRNVLRQVGANYQFRHPDLQRRLARNRASTEVSFPISIMGYDRAQVNAVVRRVNDAVESDDTGVRLSAGVEVRHCALAVRLRGYCRKEVDQYIVLATSRLVDGELNAT